MDALGQNLLSGTALPLNEDGTPSAGELLRQSQHFSAPLVPGEVVLKGVQPPALTRGAVLTDTPVQLLDGVRVIGSDKIRGTHIVQRLDSQQHGPVSDGHHKAALLQPAEPVPEQFLQPPV